MNNSSSPFEQQLAQLSTVVAQLHQRMMKFEDSAQYTFQKDIQIMDGRKIIIGGTNGTKIGASISKLGLFGASPVAQAGAISAPSAPGATYAQGDAQSAVNAIDSIINVLKNIGITL